MILTVSGWRHWADAAFVQRRLHRYNDMYAGHLHVRVGEATGVDEITRTWLRLWRGQYPGLTCYVYEADWSRLGSAAGPIRNGQMLRGEDPNDPRAGQVADKLLAFPQPGVRLRSPGSGTFGCTIEAFLLGIDIDIPGYKGPGTR